MSEELGAYAKWVGKLPPDFLEGLDGKMDEVRAAGAELYHRQWLESNPTHFLPDPLPVVRCGTPPPTTPPPEHVTAPNAPRSLYDWHTYNRVPPFIDAPEPAGPSPLAVAARTVIINTFARQHQDAELDRAVQPDTTALTEATMVLPLVTPPNEEVPETGRSPSIEEAFRMLAIALAETQSTAARKAARDKINELLGVLDLKSSPISYAILQDVLGRLPQFPRAS